MNQTSPVTETLREELSHAICRPNDTKGVVTLSKQLDAVVAIFERFALAQTPAGPREVLRSVCHAGGELGCSCADRNYQWFDHACREQIVSAFKKMLNAEAALADTSTDRGGK